MINQGMVLLDMYIILITIYFYREILRNERKNGFYRTLLPNTYKKGFENFKIYLEKWILSEICNFHTK